MDQRARRRGRAIAGHYQPHLPADLGFYDLRVAETLARQARWRGATGSTDSASTTTTSAAAACWTRRWRRCRRPLPRLPVHCLCWANENWTRHWDGGNAGAPVRSRPTTHETLRQVIADAVAHAADPRYLRVDGRPMFLVYRPLLTARLRRFRRRLPATLPRRPAFTTCIWSMSKAWRRWSSKLLPARRPRVRRLCRVSAAGLRGAGRRGPRSQVRPDFAGTATTIRIDGAGRGQPRVGELYSDIRRCSRAGTTRPASPSAATASIGASPEAFRSTSRRSSRRCEQILVGDERLAVCQCLERMGGGHPSGARPEIRPSLAGGDPRCAVSEVPGMIVLLVAPS